MNSFHHFKSPIWNVTFLLHYNYGQMETNVLSGLVIVKEIISAIQLTTHYLAAENSFCSYENTMVLNILYLIYEEYNCNWQNENETGPYPYFHYKQPNRRKNGQKHDCMNLFVIIFFQRGSCYLWW